MRDTDTGGSKGYAFINFASFEASDAALEAMNGQYLCNRPITVSYAFKKDSKGERHGSEAERFLAAQNPLPQAERPHQLFADAPPVLQMPHHMMPPPGQMFGGQQMFAQMPYGLPPPPNMPPFPPGLSHFAQMPGPPLPFAPQMMRPPPPPPPPGSMMPGPVPPPPPNYDQHRMSVM
jgi:splicing factor 3B subunit 4